jgi:hypothetical protein
MSLDSHGNFSWRVRPAVGELNAAGRCAWWCPVLGRRTPPSAARCAPRRCRTSPTPDVALHTLHIHVGCKITLNRSISDVHGTPTFFINGVKHEGPDTFEDLMNTIQQQL